MIIFFDMFLLVGILIFLIAGAKLVLDSILTILFFLVVVVVVLVVLFKFPRATLISLVVIALVIGIGLAVNSQSEEDNISVKIYKATGVCTVYDKNENIISIPAGAIIARYQDERKRQPEGTNIHGFVNVCYWYYEGSIHQFYVSNSHEISISGLPLSRWNVVELRQITYKEFNQGEWMNVE